MKSMQLQVSHAVLDALPIGIVRVDADDRFAYFNYSASQMLEIRDDGSDDMSVAARLSDKALVASLLSLRSENAGSAPRPRGPVGMGYVDHEICPSGDARAGQSRACQTVVRLTPIPIAEGDEEDLVVMEVKL